MYTALLGRAPGGQNLVLINLLLAHLQERQYVEVMELQGEIEKKEDYLDFNEKQLRMMGLFAREKFRAEDPQAFQQYMKEHRPLSSAGTQQNKGTTNISFDESQVTFQRQEMRVDDGREQQPVPKQISIVDELALREEPAIRRRPNDFPMHQPSADDVVQYNRSQAHFDDID